MIAGLCAEIKPGHHECEANVVTSEPHSSANVSYQKIIYQEYSLNVCGALLANTY
jgi:hypothetical protein